MKKQKRIFRDKFGRFTNDGRKIKTAQIGKRIFKKLSYVKKLFRTKKKKLQLIKIPVIKIKKAKKELEFKTEIYQTQIGKLEKSHTKKYSRILNWFDINTVEKLVKSFRIFYNSIKKPEKATDVKFGVILEDKNTEQYLTKFSQWTDLIFDDNELKELFYELQEWIDDILDLIEKYKVDIENILAMQIIMFKIKGHL